jgi:hypothetical protein
MTDWETVAAAKEARYEAQHGELDERALVRLGNVAYATGLALLMAGSDAAAPWLDRAAARWRESWDRGAATDAWGRPVGALKAALLAGDERSVGELALWTLSLEPVGAASSIGLYAATLALLALGRFGEAAVPGATLRGRDDFPDDVAAGLTAIAAGDHARLSVAIDSVVRSFEARRHFLEDVRVADTALVLQALARRRGLDCELPPSASLPAA